LERAPEQRTDRTRPEKGANTTVSRAARISRPETESTRTAAISASLRLRRRAAAAAAAEEVEEMLSGDIPPNQTIYLNNLNEKVKKEGTALVRLHTPNSS
jgi:hypothetical protein